MDGMSEGRQMFDLWVIPGAGHQLAQDEIDSDLATAGAGSRQA
jgi:hypothetical protein